MADMTTHAFVRIEADIKKDKIAHVVLLHGQEQPESKKGSGVGAYPYKASQQHYHYGEGA